MSRRALYFLLFSMLVFFAFSACVPLEDVDQGEVLDKPYASDEYSPFRNPGERDFFRYLRCRAFLDDTVAMRRQILLKQFEHFEAARKPERQMEAIRIEQELRDLLDNFYVQAPPDCVDLTPY